MKQYNREIRKDMLANGQYVGTNYLVFIIAKTQLLNSIMQKSGLKEVTHEINDNDDDDKRLIK